MTFEQYAEILAQLRQRLKEVELAIAALEALEKEESHEEL